MILFYSMLWRTNKSEFIVDERDHQIQSRSAMIGLLITTMFVFLFSVGLFIGYEEVGSVPVSWMWLLAYLTFAVAYFSTSSVIVLMYWKDNAE